MKKNRDRKNIKGMLWLEWSKNYREVSLPRLYMFVAISQKLSVSKFMGIQNGKKRTVRSV